jgi:hypothetical protein
MSRFYLERFIDAIPGQHDRLQSVLQDFPAKVILGDNFFFGGLPMLLGPPSKRPPVVLCGTMFLHYRRDDGHRILQGCRRRAMRQSKRPTLQSLTSTKRRSMLLCANTSTSVWRD